ncbi:MAG: dephospho-CoA kinase [Christensenella sp.]
MKRCIGLTGNSGAGKSTVAEYLKELGADIIDADEISHELCDVGAEGYAAVKKAFGEKFLRADRSLDRRALGAYVFADEEALSRLNAILHPLVIKEVRRRKAESQKEVVVIDCALLVEVGLAEDADEIWLVRADTKNKEKRICRRDNIDAQYACRRLKNQQSDDELERYADVVIANDDTVDELKKQVKGYYYEQSGKR